MVLALPQISGQKPVQTSSQESGQNQSKHLVKDLAHTPLVGKPARKEKTSINESKQQKHLAQQTTNIIHSKRHSTHTTANKHSTHTANIAQHVQ